MTATKDPVKDIKTDDIKSELKKRGADNPTTQDNFRAGRGYNIEELPATGGKAGKAKQEPPSIAKQISDQEEEVIKEVRSEIDTLTAEKLKEVNPPQEDGEAPPAKG